MSRFANEKPNSELKVTIDWFEAGDKSCYVIGEHIFFPDTGNNFPPVEKYKYLGKDENSRRIIIVPLSRFGRWVWCQRVKIVIWVRYFMDKLNERFIPY